MAQRLWSATLWLVCASGGLGWSQRPHWRWCRRTRHQCPCRQLQLDLHQGRSNWICLDCCRHTPAARLGRECLHRPFPELPAAGQQRQRPALRLASAFGLGSERLAHSCFAAAAAPDPTDCAANVPSETPHRQPLGHRTSSGLHQKGGRAHSDHTAPAWPATALRPCARRNDLVCAFPPPISRGSRQAT